MTLGNTSGPQFPLLQGQGEDASEGLSLRSAREAEVLGLEIPGPASFPWCLVRASGVPAPCLVASCLSPEDLVVSGFEASKIPPVQLGLAATSGYGMQGTIFQVWRTAGAKTLRQDRRGACLVTVRRTVWLIEHAGMKESWAGGGGTPRTTVKSLDLF